MQAEMKHNETSLKSHKKTKSDGQTTKSLQKHQHKYLIVLNTTEKSFKTL